MSTIEADRVREHEDERIRAGSVEDVIGLAVDPGELVLFQSKVLRRLTFQLFDKAVVVLTDRRLLIVSPSFTGHELTQTHLSSDCGVLNSKERFDGSRIVAIRHESGNLCLYFARPWRAQAEWICQTLGPDVQGEEPEVDRFELSQEFGGLVEVLEEQEDEFDD